MSQRDSQRRGGLGRGLAALIPTGPTETEETTGDEASATRPSVPAPARQQGKAQGINTTRMGSAAADVLMGGPPSPAPVEPAGDMGAVYREIPPSEIEPNPQQPRTVFDEEALAELEHSIREFGLMQPIVVRELARPKAGGVRYQLIMGERRWRASTNVGLEKIPAIVRETSDADLLRDALLENIHRAQLNPLEEAAAYQQLLEEFDVTHEELANRLGRSRPVITNMIRLLKLPIPVQRRVAAGVLSAGHARALLALDAGADAQEALAARIVAEGMSVRATEEAVTLANHEGVPDSPAPAKRRPPMVMPGLQDVADRLSDRLDTKVSVSLSKRKGKVVIEFGSVDDLERIVGVISDR
ncbi:ParB/RepB/Spo0J family partition protein [Gordonia sp. PP30]|uniref:ParB/RepB/Spo0J family partition protein n=1 Tax=unclassified Gordonia (in: high G+C Gram-positive bacteria) TaxID=2657482 RepID=UPI001FFF1E76|nr:ParB/RepB/Spo0J family partition protein [Gordonia sp. PP30]UQE75068.1 ParB/RepB/Spo0J family partition protein [Gordonia sp. PP30]